MMKAALLAAAALVVGVSAANAKTLKYTFATSSGSPYCDGVTLKSSDNVVYSGAHTGSCEAQPNDSAGGLAVKLGTVKVVDVATQDSVNAPGIVLTYLLDTKDSTWALYGDFGSGFQLGNQGELLKGAPPARAGAKASVQFKK